MVARSPTDNKTQIVTINHKENFDIGATASIKGGANFTPFAAAKSAQRSLAQSLARYLDLEKIHVSYLILDGVVDLERTRQAIALLTQSFEGELVELNNTQEQFSAASADSKTPEETFSIPSRPNAEDYDDDW